MNLLQKGVLAVSIAVLSCAALSAQSTASLRGQVLDPSGAAVPNATVIVSGPAGTVKVATTDSAGAYTVVGLPGGAYTVRVTATGFALFERAGFDVTTGRGSVLDIPL